MNDSKKNRVNKWGLDWGGWQYNTNTLEIIVDGEMERWAPVSTVQQCVTSLTRSGFAYVLADRGSRAASGAVPTPCSIVDEDKKSACSRTFRVRREKGGCGGLVSTPPSIIFHESRWIYMWREYSSEQDKCVWLSKKGNKEHGVQEEDVIWSLPSAYPIKLKMESDTVSTAMTPASTIHQAGKETDMSHELNAITVTNAALFLMLSKALECHTFPLIMKQQLMDL